MGLTYREKIIEASEIVKQENKETWLSLYPFQRNQRIESAIVDIGIPYGSKRNDAYYDVSSIIEEWLFKS